MNNDIPNWSACGYNVESYPYDGTVVILECTRADDHNSKPFITVGFSEEPGTWVSVEIEWHADEPSRIFLCPTRWYPMPKSLSAPALRLVK